MKNQLKLKEHNKKGILIVFEGTDGAGKTTLMKHAVEFLRKNTDAVVVTTKQPTNRVRRSKLFSTMLHTENPDVDYRAVQLSTLSDRLDHQCREILPALNEGKIVVCDRYIYTSVANMLARGYKNEDWFFTLAKQIVRPDIIFHASAEPELAISRIRSRENEKDKFLDEPLLRGVYDQFHKMAKKQGFITLDTSAPMENNKERISNILREVC